MRHRAFEYLSGLPGFALYFALGMLLLGLFIVIYLRITPHRELTLIREGNVAAAASLGGAVIGFVLPLTSAIEHSVSLEDMLLWAGVALVVQLLAFVIVRMMVPAISANVQQGQTASGVFLGAMAISLGLINAACMTW